MFRLCQTEHTKTHVENPTDHHLQLDKKIKDKKKDKNWEAKAKV